MQAAVLPDGGASLLQLPLVSHDPPLELVHVSPEHPTAAAGPAVATKPTTAANEVKKEMTSASAMTAAPGRRVCLVASELLA
jgi:hypothetical protein